MRFVFTALLIVFTAFSVYAQSTIKVKREDNRFLFYQISAKKDTILKNKSDLFLIKIPDSLKHVLRIHLNNGQFIKTKKDSIFQLIPIAGMKYSHSKPDTIFNTLLEGNCTPSKTITIDFINIHNNKLILSNKFIVK